jgi:hypothetical protein
MLVLRSMRLGERDGALRDAERRAGQALWRMRHKRLARRSRRLTSGKMSRAKA